jgi:hypothetical protein
MQLSVKLEIQTFLSMVIKALLSLHSMLQNFCRTPVFNTASHWKTVRVIENNYYRSNCLDAANRVRSSYNQNDRFNIKGYGSVVGPSVDAVYVLSDNVVCSIRQF